MEARFCLLRAAEMPTSSLTLAPGCEPKVTVTVANLTGLPMSIRRPEPALSRPKSALAYHCDVQLVRRLLSIAYLAYWVFSLPGSAEGLVRGSKPVAPTGCSTVTDVGGVLRFELGWLTAGPPLGHSANVAIAARTSTPAPTARALGNRPDTSRNGDDSRRLRRPVPALSARRVPRVGRSWYAPSPAGQSVS